MQLANGLADSVVTFRGLHARGAADDSMLVAPGETKTIRFTATRAGTFLSSARAGTDDRIFVINVWGSRWTPRGSATR